MRKSNSQLKLFEGILISPVGEITLIVGRKGNRRDLRFQVVNSTNKPLLSVETCGQLELLKVELDPEESINSVKNSLLTRDQSLEITLTCLRRQASAALSTSTTSRLTRKSQGQTC